MAIVGIFAVLLLLPPKPPIQLALGDGRILQIEGVTYGTEHRMGRNSKLERFQPWMPGPLARLVASDRRENVITWERPGLVVWVNAISATGQTNVDCQGIRVEFVGKHGDLFGEATCSWFGGSAFWRVGHVFDCYPRDERELTLRVTPWKKGEAATTTILNPHFVQPAKWSGAPLPQSKMAGDMEVRLTGLTVHTNGQGKNAYYETAARYFEPVFDIFQGNASVAGWDEPEWFAEDPSGNRGQYLGVNQPVLRFQTTIYPAATNLQAARLVATLPATDLIALTTNLWWNKTNVIGSNAVVVLGLFPSGTHTFSEREYESSSATVNGPRGGAPSGWTGMSRRLSPMHVKETHSHYTPSPVIYLGVKPHAPDTAKPVDVGDFLGEGGVRLAIRLRDEHGRFFQTKPGGTVDGIQPFLIELPQDVTNVVPEVVLLRPVSADFLVETGKASLR